MFGQLGSNRFVVKRGRGVRKNGGTKLGLGGSTICPLRVNQSDCGPVLHHFASSNDRPSTT
ncbi:hypothetical protein BLOT_010664 [Blomia tropicalis]|nr:hypothetical protein BLOT_010664 [Blomia tropicalis]